MVDQEKRKTGPVVGGGDKYTGPVHDGNIARIPRRDIGLEADFRSAVETSSPSDGLYATITSSMEESVYTPPKRRRGAKNTMVVLPAFALALLVFVVDRGVKLVVENAMTPEESVPIIPDFLSLTYILNDGGAFGILGGSQLILMAGSAVAVAVVLWMLLAGPPSKLMTVGCGLILGGAAGNLYDRVTSGEVTDYIHFSFWYIFNAADAAIVTGVGMLLISSFFPTKDRA